MFLVYACSFLSRFFIKNFSLEHVTQDKITYNWPYLKTEFAYYLIPQLITFFIFFFFEVLSNNVFEVIEFNN